LNEEVVVKMLSIAGAGVAGLGLLLAIASSGATSASPRRVFVAQRTYPAVGRRSLSAAQRNVATPVPCSTDYAAPPTPQYFVGIAANNIAGGQDAAVLGGYDNDVCATWSGIGAGKGNRIVASANNRASFIAGGYSNMVSASAGDAFIGGGEFNSNSGYDSFAGAGYENALGGDNAFLGAGSYNSASGGNSAVAAGYLDQTSGANAFVGGGDGNSVSGDNSVVAGGVGGLVSHNSSFIGGGGSASYMGCVCISYGNRVSGYDAFVGAGDQNNVSGNGSFIGGGGYVYASNSPPPTTPGNQIAGTDSFIGAGDQNVVDATEAFIGSGGTNTIGTAASYATILGGNRNSVSGEYASILGGFGNVANGSYAIVAGGDGDTADGTLSFAAGYHVDVTHNGTFAWSDYSTGSTSLKDTAANQFLVRASGGTYLYSNEGATTGVVLSPGSGTWASLSDRNAKTGVVALDDASILTKVAALPISTWSYKSESGVRHVGPMAQDFYAAFGVGADDRHITSIDEDGVALAAVKALAARERADRLRADVENSGLRARVASLVAQNEAFARRLDRLSALIGN
jgi:trimeric autotransporter adhesin